MRRSRAGLWPAGGQVLDRVEIQMNDCTKEPAVLSRPTQKPKTANDTDTKETMRFKAFRYVNVKLTNNGLTNRKYFGSGKVFF